MCPTVTLPGLGFCFPRFSKVIPCEYSVCSTTNFYYSMSSETSDDDAENDTADDLYWRGESGFGTRRQPAKPSRKLPKEYDTYDSDDQVEIVVKKRCHKRLKIKDSTDKGSSSSDYETIFDERGSTSDSDPGKTLIQRCFRECNGINQQSSYEHFDEYRVDDDVYIFERTFKDPSNIFKDPVKDLSKILIKIF